MIPTKAEHDAWMAETTAKEAQHKAITTQEQMLLSGRKRNPGKSLSSF